MEPSTRTRNLRFVLIGFYTLSLLYTWISYFAAALAFRNVGVNTVFPAETIVSLSVSLITSFGFLILIIRKRYGILFFLTIGGGFSLVWNLIDPMKWQHVNATVLYYINLLIPVITGILSFLLLTAETGRFFDFRFTSKIDENYRSTQNWIRGFIITFLFIGILFLTFFLTQEGLDKFLVRYIILLSIILFLLIVGFKNGKWNLLSFGLALYLTQSIFHKVTLFIVMPFTGNWNDGWAMIGIVFGLVLDVALVILTVLLITSIRKYLIATRRIM